MVRCALPTCLALGLALVACGKSKAPAFPRVSIPAPTSWDGTQPEKGSVLIISPLPGNASQFVTYEVSTSKCAINRTIVSDLDAIKGLMINPLTNPKDGATFSVVRILPPPPPEGEGLLREAMYYTRGPNDPRPLSCKPQQLPKQ